MPQTNFPVTFGYQAVESKQVAKTVYETVETKVNKSMSLTLSDSMLGVLQDAQAIANQLGQSAVTTEIVALAILTRKTPKNVTTTGGRMLRDNFGVNAARLATFVAEKHGRSVWNLSEKFGGLRSY